MDCIDEQTNPAPVKSRRPRFGLLGMMMLTTGLCFLFAAHTKQGRQTLVPITSTVSPSETYRGIGDVIYKSETPDMVDSLQRMDARVSRQRRGSIDIAELPDKLRRCIAYPVQSRTPKLPPSVFRSARRAEYCETLAKHIGVLTQAFVNSPFPAGSPESKARTQRYHLESLRRCNLLWRLGDRRGLTWIHNNMANFGPIAWRRCLEDVQRAVLVDGEFALPQEQWQIEGSLSISEHYYQAHYGRRTLGTRAVKGNKKFPSVKPDVVTLGQTESDDSTDFLSRATTKNDFFTKHHWWLLNNGWLSTESERTLRGLNWDAMTEDRFFALVAEVSSRAGLFDTTYPTRLSNLDMVRFLGGIELPIQIQAVSVFRSRYPDTPIDLGDHIIRIRVNEKEFAIRVNESVTINTSDQIDVLNALLEHFGHQKRLRAASVTPHSKEHDLVMLLDDHEFDYLTANTGLRFRVPRNVPVDLSEHPSRVSP